MTFLKCVCVLFLIQNVPLWAEEGKKNAGAKESKEDRLKGINTVKKLLVDKQWSMRIFGLMRAEHFIKEKEQIKEILLQTLKDQSWQVRCFALYTIKRMAIEFPVAILAKEKNLCILRLALHLDLALKPALFRNHILGKLKSRNLSEVVMALEICVLSDDAKLREAAVSKIRSLARRMKADSAIPIGHRLAALLGTAEPVLSAWAAVGKSKNVTLVSAAQFKKKVAGAGPTKIALLSEEKFQELVFYLDGLQSKTIDIAIAIDGTGSMGGVIKRTQRQINNLILILNALTESMEVGIIIYRDKGDGRPEVKKLSYNIEAVQKFLFKVEAKGGGDFPESILSGVKKLKGLGWRKKSKKQLIIIADAPPHQHEMDDIQEIIEDMKRYDNFSTNCLDCANNQKELNSTLVN